MRDAMKEPSWEGDQFFIQLWRPDRPAARRPARPFYYLMVLCDLVSLLDAILHESKFLFLNSTKNILLTTCYY